MTSPDGLPLSAYQKTQGQPVGGWDMDINLGELGVQLLFGPLRKLLSTVTGLPESTWPNTSSLIAGLQDQFGEVPILGDLIEVITGREDGNLDDLGTWINQLKTLLSGGTVSNPLPTLVDMALGTVQRMVQQIADILNGLVVTPINSAIQGVKDWFANLLGWQSTTTSNVSAASVAAASVKDTITSGQVVSQGLIDGLQYQLSVFTSNGTFTPPTPPSGYEIAYYVGTVYGGGESGSKFGSGDTGGVDAPGGRNGGRASRRLSVAEVGSSVSITVGAGGATKTNQGKQNAGGSSYIGPSESPLLVSTARTSSVPTPYGDLPSSGIPGDGGYGGRLRYVNGSDYTLYPGGDGDPSSGANGGNAGTTGTAWWGGTTTTSPTAGSNGTISGDHTTGGGGGGGGGSRVGIGNAPQAGAAGGAPGAGGGAGGGHSNGGGNGGAGGRGQVDMLTVFKEVA